MGYRPEDQALEGPCDAIIDGIDKFTEASSRRIESGGWEAEHEEELVDLLQQFVQLRTHLIRLKRDTW